jgi:hypothetical protein
LARDVIKNTHLKVAHRVVAEDDRRTLGGTMAMDELQMRALAVLPTGRAAVFSGGDDAPLLIQVPLAKPPTQRLPEDGTVARRSLQARSQDGLLELMLPFGGCNGVCIAAGHACASAAAIVEDNAFRRVLARVLLSTVGDPAALDRRWGEVQAVIGARLPPKLPPREFLPCLAVRAARWFATHRGAQAGWSYAETGKIGVLLRDMLLVKMRGEGAADRTEFARAFRAFSARDGLPYPLCEAICPGVPALCLYRTAVADLVARGSFRAAWQEADRADTLSREHRRSATWEVCLEAGYALVEYVDDVPEAAMPVTREISRKVGLCFAQQMIFDDARRSPKTATRIMQQILVERT